MYLQGYSSARSGNLIERRGLAGVGIIPLLPLALKGLPLIAPLIAKIFSKKHNVANAYGTEIAGPYTKAFGALFDQFHLQPPQDLAQAVEYRGGLETLKNWLYDAANAFGSHGGDYNEIAQRGIRESEEGTGGTPGLQNLRAKMDAAIAQFQAQPAPAAGPITLPSQPGGGGTIAQPTIPRRGRAGRAAPRAPASSPALTLQPSQPSSFLPGEPSPAAPMPSDGGMNLESMLPLALVGLVAYFLFAGRR